MSGCPTLAAGLPQLPRVLRGPHVLRPDPDHRPQGGAADRLHDPLLPKQGAPRLRFPARVWATRTGLPFATGPLGRTHRTQRRAFTAFTCYWVGHFRPQCSPLSQVQRQYMLSRMGLTCACDAPPLTVPMGRVALHRSIPPFSPSCLFRGLHISSLTTSSPPPQQYLAVCQGAGTTPCHPAIQPLPNANLFRWGQHRTGLGCRTIPGSGGVEAVRLRSGPGPGLHFQNKGTTRPPSPAVYRDTVADSTRGIVATLPPGHCGNGEGGAAEAWRASGARRGRTSACTGARTG